VGFVLDDAQKLWAEKVRPSGITYRAARAVLYSGATSTACGYGQAASGPFYCPRDQKVYLDLTFFDQLHRRFGAPGDFAQAYVIAHEIGHHVQQLQGVFEALERQPRSARSGAGQGDVRAELQADCYAGVWAHDAARRKLLDPGDLEEALRAATAVGDDTLQKQSTGTVRPEKWTHGSSEQRARWFRRGFDSGEPRVCDTFGAAAL
jgi:predicted metalloprotease